MAEGYQTDKEMELLEALLRMMRVQARNHCIIEGTVTAVDTTQYTCSVSVGDGDSSIVFSDVSLEVLVGSAASFTLLPVVGSIVLMAFRDGHQDRPQILKVDQIDEIIANPKTKFIFNTGTNGIPKTPETVEQLNAIQRDLNNLKTLVSEWVPASGDGGAALKTILASWFGSMVPVTQDSDIASTKVFQ